MNERGAFAARVEHVDDSRQFLEVDEHLGCDVFRGGTRRRDAHGDVLAHLPHLVAREHMLLRRLESRQAGIRDDGLDVGEIGERVDGVREPRRLLDRDDMAVRDRTAYERDIDHADHANVAHILAPAVHEAVVFLARERCADALWPVR